MKIVPVLLNPTIDQIYEISNFYVGGTFKVTNYKIFPVGKAISFSLGVRELSKREEVYLKLIALIGQEDLSLYSKFLKSKYIDYEFIEVKGKTRSNKTINDPVRKTTTHIREMGFSINEENLDQMINALKENIEENDLIVFSGSIPPGCPINIYFNFINICKKKKALSILDSNGPALTEGVKANPSIIKPNLVELSQILNNPELNSMNIKNIIQYCVYLVKKAKSLLNKDLKIILITLGEKGAILLTKGSSIYGNVKVENIIDTVGSGDSFLAGFLTNYFLKKDLEQCFRNAIACGAANTLIPGPGIFFSQDVKKLIKKVELINLF